MVDAMGLWKVHEMLQETQSVRCRPSSSLSWVQTTLPMKSAEKPWLRLKATIIADFSAAFGDVLEKLKTKGRIDRLASSNKKVEKAKAIRIGASQTAAQTPHYATFSFYPG